MSPYEDLTEIAPKREAEGDKPSAGPVYKAAVFKDADTSVGVSGATTLFEMFDGSVKKFAKNKCLGWRPIVDEKPGAYEYWTYEETGAKVQALASGMAQSGATSAGSKVGVFGPNSPQWMLAMQACNRMSLTCVPLYDTLGEDSIRYIIEHAEAQIVFVDGRKIDNLSAALPAVKTVVKNVYYWGDVEDSKIKAIQDLGIQIASLDDTIAAGESNPVEAVPPKPEDLCTIMYTSGTTGVPKGVVLTHKAVISMCGSTRAYMDKYNKMGEEDVFLSYLPLAHIFDRTAEELFLGIGGAICYWGGDIKGLVDDIAAAKPTLFVGVPRVFDRIRAGIKAKTAEAGGVKKFLFEWGYNRKLNFLKQGYRQAKASPVFDKVVFSKIKQKLGGSVKIVVSGGAPIASHTEEFLRVCFCCPVVQGYGLTETCAGSFLSLPDRMDHMATVGLPTPSTEFRLESVPDMNYDALGDEPKGEILVKSDCNFSEYYKNEAETSKVLEKDGWFHTGDIGTLVGDGVLKIIDRKKNIFKLAQGEYIMVEKVEEVYKKCPEVDQIWVYGDSFQSYLVGVIIPQEPFVMKWAKEEGISGDFGDIVKNEKLAEYLLKSLTQVAKESGLKGFECIRKLHVDSAPFSVENDTITPTFKLKRPQLKKYYQEQLDELYKE